MGSQGPVRYSACFSVCLRSPTMKGVLKVTVFSFLIPVLTHDKNTAVKSK